MNISAEINRDTFLSRLNILENALNQRKLISDRLEVVDKWSFKWIVLRLCSPFYSLVCQDAFSHVRVHRVEKSLLAYFRANKDYADAATIKNFKDKILTPLFKRTNQNSVYESDFEDCQPLPPIKWPADLNVLQLSEAQKNLLDAALKEVLPYVMGFDEQSYSLICRKKIVNGQKQRKLQLEKNSSIIKEFDVPITIKCWKHIPLRTTQIFLWTKVILGEGGQRKVKRCYDLIAGEFSVRKKVCSKIEQLILKHFQYQPSLGIEPITLILEKEPDRGVKSDHILQPVFEGTLRSLYNEIKDLKDVFSIMHQLLTGLSELHDCSPVEVTVNYENGNFTTTRTTYPKMWHTDIKPDNILMRRLPDSGKWEAVFSDFGLSGQINPGSGSVGYRSPEDLNLYCKLLSLPNSGSEEDIEIFDSYKYKKDVWSLGIVFAGLLTGELNGLIHTFQEKKTLITLIPPIQCLIDGIRKGKINGEWDGFLIDLDQKCLDRDIALLKAKAIPSYARIWDELILKMLQVDYNKRISAKEALEIMKRFV